jgi:hypothetical protein
LIVTLITNVESPGLMLTMIFATCVICISGTLPP